MLLSLVLREPGGDVASELGLLSVLLFAGPPRSAPCTLPSEPSPSSPRSRSLFPEERWGLTRHTAGRCKEARPYAGLP